MEYVPAKTMISRTKSSAWFGTEYNMNLYRGCCHGCIYCDSRSDCYHIEEFDRVRAKENALKILSTELRSKVKTGVVATGAMSDPYNPFEQEQKLTRHALELLSAYGFGVAIATKSPLVARDVDVLQEIARHSPVIVKITITCADDALCKKLEPHVAPSSQRFEAVRTLSHAGIFTGLLMMPILPFIEDTEENVGTIIRTAYESGAKFIYPAFGVTLRQGQREYFYRKLEEQFPGLKERYQKRFGDRYECASPNAGALWRFFQAECNKLGLLYKMQDIVRAYKQGYGDGQLSLF